MHIALWRYVVPADTRAAFMEAYGSRGVWAELFRKAPGYIGTRLYEDSEEPGSFITIDLWVDEQSRVQFLEQHREAYTRLDERTATLTTTDANVGFLQSAAPW